MQKKRPIISRTCNYLLNVFAPLFPDKIFLQWKFYFVMGHKLNLKNPQTFNEKLQWLKLYDKHPEYTKMVDKIEAKKYVASIIGEEYIIPTIAVYDHIKDVDFDKLPKQFVLKCTHDSGGVVICRDKLSLDKKGTIKKLHKGLKHSFFIQNREYPYKNVDRRIIVEKYMEDKSNSDLIDFKFFCFDGRAEYCQVITNRSIDETIDFYDRQWKHQDFIGLSPYAHNATKPQNIPFKYIKMLEIADTIAKNIKAPFVRIDLYNINNSIYFGEITFFPLSGMGKFTPQKWDYKLGKLLKLPNNK